MHCRIFKLQDKFDEVFTPICEEDYYEGFVGSIADYVQTIDEDEWFDEYTFMGGLYHFADGGKEIKDENGDDHHLYTVTIYRAELVEYLKAMKDKFTSRVREIEMDAPDAEHEVAQFFDYPMKAMMEDRFGNYIEWDGWQTEQRFFVAILQWMMREGKAEVTLRLEGVLDYHY